MLKNSTDAIRPLALTQLQTPAKEGLGLRALVSAIGRPTFEGELVRCLSEMYGADYLHLFQLPDDRPRCSTALSRDGSRIAEQQSKVYQDERLWRFDLSMAEGSGCPSVQPVLFHPNTMAPESSELRHFYQGMQISERVLVCGRGPEGVLGLSIMRSALRGPFSPEEQMRLGVLVEVAFPLLVRHYGLRWESSQLVTAITSLQQIEKCLALASEKLPRREAQVAARMLYGLTAAGIASEFKIGCETVIGYRKSLYKRLEVNGFRELLLWYLKLYQNVCHQLIY
jgi:DNA-binding CsgD family transcriptional regulator